MVITLGVSDFTVNAVKRALKSAGVKGVTVIGLTGPGPGDPPLNNATLSGTYDALYGALTGPFYGLTPADATAYLKP